MVPEEERGKYHVVEIPWLLVDGGMLISPHEMLPGHYHSHSADLSRVVVGGGGVI